MIATHMKLFPYHLICITTLYENYYNIEIEDKYLVQMRSQTKATGIMLPEVHGTKKKVH